MSFDNIDALSTQDLYNARKTCLTLLPDTSNIVLNTNEDNSAWATFNIKTDAYLALFSPKAAWSISHMMSVNVSRHTLLDTISKMDSILNALEKAPTLNGFKNGTIYTPCFPKKSTIPFLIVEALHFPPSVSMQPLQSGVLTKNDIDYIIPLALRTGDTVQLRFPYTEQVGESMFKTTDSGLEGIWWQKWNGKPVMVNP